MFNVLQMKLPWHNIRSKLVQEDEEGILYETMFQGYHLKNSRIRMVGILISRIFVINTVVLF